MTHHERYDHFDRRTLDQNVDALTTLIGSRIDEGWSPYLMTLMFARIARVPGDPTAVIGRMGDAADRLYRTFLTNVVRRPTSPRAVGSMPILIVAPDKPVPKRFKASGAEVALNDGAHIHGVLIVPPRTRLRTTADVHFREHRALYVRAPLISVDVRPIVATPDIVLGYVLKSVRRRRFSFDDVLILPRAIAELN
jgi:hypothetical protein